MSREPRNPGAGLGDPYWYEWSVGLRYVIDLLDADSGVIAVTLQKSGYKGLDDVVVEFADGHSRYIQVRHTRAQDTLTFGDFVSPHDSSLPLLSQMAKAWLRAGQPSEVWLVTNRIASVQVTRTREPSSIVRPSLAEFLPWLANELQRGRSLSEFEIRSEWRESWEKEWLSQLEILPTDQQRHLFLDALEIRHSEENLIGLTDQLEGRIVAIFSVTAEVARDLLARLDSSLRTWATSARGTEEAITREAVYDKLCLAVDTPVGDHNLVPPAPFFPSRLAVLEKLKILLYERRHPVVFLVGEPGSGKTALISELAGQRDHIIDARFHAYRPITPENQLLPADAGRTTTARALWSDLLIQLRVLARGRLAELQVPVHAGSLDVQQIREHVLRLASALAATQVRPFVIAVDGIDHAARAGTTPESFLDTLVPPEQLPENVVFLIGGQQPAAYSQYPVWLRADTAGVHVFDLPRLDLQDIHALVDARLVMTPAAERATAAREILELCVGHTLSTVFAIEEAVLVEDDLSQLPAVLAGRQLSSGVVGYYNIIWSAATQGLGEHTVARLAACLTLSPSRTTPAMVSAIAQSRGAAVTRWIDVLRSLRPLVVEESSGFRVFHNDIRVFLLRRLRGDPVVYEECASLLADYLRGGDDVAAKHAAVQKLYGIAKRPSDQASLFTPAYVLEGHAIGQPIDALAEQGIVAAECLARIDSDWQLAHAVATGLRTLEQLRASLQWRDEATTPGRLLEPAATRAAERRVPSRADWTFDLVGTAMDDMHELCALGEWDRAAAAFKRWFQRLQPLEVDVACKALSKTEDRHQEATLTLLAKIGRMSVSADEFLPVSNGEGAADAEAAYSSGLLDGLETACSDCVFRRTLRRLRHYFLADVENLLLRLADRRAWRRCGLLLQRMAPDVRYPLTFRLTAGLVASVIGAPRLRARWTQPVLNNRTASIADSVSFAGGISEGVDRLQMMFRLALLLGVEEPDREASGLREEFESIYRQTRRDERQDSGVAQIVYAAALLGSFLRTTRDNRARAIHVDSTAIANAVKMLVTASKRPHYLLPLGYQQIAVLLVLGFVELSSQHPEVERALGDVFLAEIRAGNSLGVFLTTGWRLLARTGQRPALVKYADMWIGSEGRGWSEAPADRHHIINVIADLLVEIGETATAETAHDRLRWAHIGYTGHKEYVLHQALAWFEHLADYSPSVWKEEGLRLFALSREASRTGDNRLSPQAESAVLTAACLDGPTALASLLFANESALEPGADVVLTGLLHMLGERAMGREALLAVWAFCTGQLCWQVDSDRRRLFDVREAILSSGTRSAVTGLAEAMEAMAPAEFACGQDEDAASSATAYIPPSYERYPVDRALEIAVESRDWKGVISSMERAESEGGKILGDSVSIVWGGLRALPLFAWWHDGADAVYQRLFPLLTTAERWEVVKSLVSGATESSVDYRTYVIAENLDDACRFSALVSGEDSLRGGCGRLLDMHELWITGSGHLPPMKQPSLSSEVGQIEWPLLFLEMLVRLLEFDEQTYVLAALRGICRLLEVESSLYDEIISRVQNEQLKVQRRFLLAAEELAVRQSAVELRKWLEELQDSTRLDIALTAWVALRGGRRALDGSEVPWPEPEGEPPAVVRVAPPLLTRTTSRIGLYEVAARASSSKLEFLRVACEESLDDVESSFGASVREDPPIVAARRTRDLGVRDFVSNPEEEAELDRLFEVLRTHERSGRFASVSPVRLAQALVPAVDPFVFLRTPSVHGKLGDWPVDKELDEALSAFPVLVEDLVALLSSDLPESTHTIGGVVQTFSESWDVKVSLYYVAPRHTSVNGSRPPCVLNPRSSLGFEEYGRLLVDQRPQNRIWLTTMTGGLFPFPDALVDSFPGECREALGWRPVASDPLCWERDAKLVARFERMRGPLRNMYLRDLPHRQPMLSRWVCPEDEWTRLVKLLGEPIRVVVPEHAQLSDG